MKTTKKMKNQFQQSNKQKLRIVIISLLLIMIFWVFDFATTVIGLSLGATETNLITKGFFESSNYFLLFVFTISIILAVFGFLELSFLISRRLFNVDVPLYVESVFYSSIVVYFILNSIYAITNNFIVIMMLQ